MTSCALDHAGNAASNSIHANFYHQVSLPGSVPLLSFQRSVDGTMDGMKWKF